MPDATLVINMESGEQLGPRRGRDRLPAAPHAGAPPRPLGKGASGGELSRVMLALEVVLAAVDPVPTFVFDEVDSGVGGKAAVEIGRRLAMLAQHVQVLVVTHLPQVAAFADQHILVTKSSVRESATATFHHQQRAASGRGTRPGTGPNAGRAGGFRNSTGPRQGIAGRRSSAAAGLNLP